MRCDCFLMAIPQDQIWTTLPQPFPMLLLSLSMLCFRHRVIISAKIPDGVFAPREPRWPRRPGRQVICSPFWNGHDGPERCYFHDGIPRCLRASGRTAVSPGRTHSPLQHNMRMVSKGRDPPNPPPDRCEQPLHIRSAPYTLIFIINRSNMKSVDCHPESDSLE